MMKMKMPSMLNFKKMTSMDIMAFAAVAIVIFMLVSRYGNQRAVCEGFSKEQVAEFISELDTQKANMTEPPVKKVSFNKTPSPIQIKPEIKPEIKTEIKTEMKKVATDASKMMDGGEPSPFMKFTSFAPYSSADVKGALDDWTSCGPKKPATTTTPPVVAPIVKPPSVTPRPSASTTQAPRPTPPTKALSQTAAPQKPAVRRSAP